MIFQSTIWLNNLGCHRVREDNELTNRIEIIFKAGRGNYGTRPIKKELSGQSIVVSRRRIARLMKEASLVCKTKRKFKATTNSHHKKQIAPNLLDRKFTVLDANCYWVGDITYVPTSELDFGQITIRFGDKIHFNKRNLH